MRYDNERLCLFSQIALRLNQGACIAMGIALTAATLLMFMQVMTRYLLGIAHTWVEELVRYSGMTAAVLGLSPLTRTDAYIRVDLFYDRIKRSRLSRILIDAFVGFCLIVLLVEGWNLVEFGMRSRTPGLRIPFGYVYTTIPLGAFLGLVQLVDGWIRHPERWRRGAPR
ncbi:MAG: TRAP transporter small permease [Firmicutes bacterium]|jgi:TRAP-type C4-dicarboxylate transport system permease small subunit|nr:TRAP transporter small permease [Bacillota bacterium]